MNGDKAELEPDIVTVTVAALDVTRFIPPGGVFPDLPKAATFAQDFHWSANAPDSLQHNTPKDFVVDNPVTLQLGTMGNTFVLTTSSNGVPYLAFSKGPPLPVAFVTPPTISVSGSSIRMVGGFVLTPAPEALSIKLFDQDFSSPTQLMLTQVALSIPTGIAGVPNIWFDTSATLFAEWSYLPVPAYYIVGTGEWEAELYFEVHAATGLLLTSPTKSVSGGP